MAADTHEPMEGWLLRRVAQAVEAGEVPWDLLAELQTEPEASRAKPPEQGWAENRHRENIVILDCENLARVYEEEWAEIETQLP